MANGTISAGKNIQFLLGTQANLEKYITSEKDLALCDCLLRFPEVIETAARDLAPHQIAFYAKNLAAEFHAWYNSTRILSENLAEQNARLLLISAVQIVIKNAMKFKLF